MVGLVFGLLHSIQAIDWGKYEVLPLRLSVECSVQPAWCKQAERFRAILNLDDLSTSFIVKLERYFQPLEYTNRQIFASPQRFNILPFVLYTDSFGAQILPNPFRFFYG